MGGIFRYKADIVIFLRYAFAVPPCRILGRAWIAIGSRFYWVPVRLQKGWTAVGCWVGVLVRAVVQLWDGSWSRRRE